MNEMERDGSASMLCNSAETLLGRNKLDRTQRRVVGQAVGEEGSTKVASCRDVIPVVMTLIIR